MNTLYDSRILIVDDAPENVEILGAILKDYKRSVALNGERALKIANGSNPPDLILLDIVMPGMDGFTVCQLLKEQESTRNIPVIFITGNTSVEDETRGLTLGAVDFIAKPINPPVVLARVKNHLELSITRQQLAKQNQQLEQHNKFITDSIEYAKKIQTAILPNEGMLRELFPESFLIFEPKDVVSGDFYWIGKTGTKKIAAVVDCTGHGVPGAFMSMIGNTLLNDLVNVKHLDNPAAILHALDEGIILELNKNVNSGSFDGMDIAVCVFDEESGRIDFASACRPLFYSTGDDLVEIRGDRKSIGDNRKSVHYTTHTLPWVEGICIYMMSDGFIDQQDSSNAKFGIRHTRALLRSLYQKPMAEQRLLLLEAFRNHRQQEPQRDDVTILGISLTGSAPKAAPVKTFVELDHDDGFLYIAIDGTCGHDAQQTVTGLIAEHGAGILMPAEIKHIIFCSNELIQNIGFYSHHKDASTGTGVGKYELVVNAHQITMRGINPSDSDSYTRLSAKIAVLNNYSTDELKQHYKEKLRLASDAFSKGGGIGLIEIRRKTKNTLQVTGSELNGHYFLTVQATILRGTTDAKPNH